MALYFCFFIFVDYTEFNIGTIIFRWERVGILFESECCVDCVDYYNTLSMWLARMCPAAQTEWMCDAKQVLWTRRRRRRRRRLLRLDIILCMFVSYTLFCFCRFQQFILLVYTLLAVYIHPSTSFLYKPKEANTAAAAAGRRRDCVFSILSRQSRETTS